LRAIVRTVIAALPIAGIVVAWIPLVLSGKPNLAEVFTILVMLLLLAAGFIHALCRPTRTIADAIAGTTIVPR
jgi:hypothetical protein